MDNLKIWFYVILGVIYLLSRMRKKPSNESTPVPDRQPERPRGRMENPQSTGGNPKALTFEELLKEITEAKTQSSKPSPTVQKPNYPDYYEEIEVKEVKVKPNKPKKAKKLEPVREPMFQHTSLEETMKLENTDTSFGRFKGFYQEQERNLLEEYTRDFHDPEGFKKAFVLSEILKRKFV